MPYEIIRLTSADYEEAMDLMNMVFSMSSQPHHFQSMLPKLYQPDDMKMHAHFAIRNQGKLRAVIGCYPMLLQVGSRQWPVNGIGAVSTHPDERKSGMMRQLMQAIMQDMKQSGHVLSVLGGQRQRYGYYGYEIAGSRLTCSLNKTNLRHFYRGQEPANIQFERMNGPDAVPDADASVSLMKTWHDRQPVHVVRPLADYLTILSSWYHAVWLARDISGQPVAYLVSNKEGNLVSELITERPEHLLAAASAWVAQQDGDAVTFSLAAWQVDAIADLGHLCEQMQLTPAYSICIIDWATVLTGLLEVKASLQPIPAGAVNLGIEDQGQVQVFRLSWSGSQASCEAVPREQAELVLDRLTATRLVLGPLPPAWVIPKNITDSRQGQLLSLWFPLPFSWRQPDEV